MSVNRRMPHLYVLPEDDANRQLANGFVLDQSLDTRRIQILEEAGGWLEVIHRFESDYVHTMNKYATRFMVLLIDFDGRVERLDRIKNAVPAHLKERVFVLGSWTDPEALRQRLGPYEDIGLKLAKDCRNHTSDVWAHELLCHNGPELERLRLRVRPFLFAPELGN